MALRINAFVLTLLLQATAVQAGTRAVTAGDPASRDVRSFFNAIFAPKEKPAPGTFEIRKCPHLSGQELAKVLLLNQKATTHYQFAPQCDLQGDVSFTRSPFPFDLAIRNLKGASYAKGTVVTDMEPRLAQDEMAIKISVKKGIFEKSDHSADIAYDLNYLVVLGFDGAIKRNEGGTLKISRLHGKTVSLTEKIKAE